MKKIYALLTIILLTVTMGYSVAEAASLNAPTSVKAVTVSSNQINLSWVDTNPSESGFEIWRSLNQTTGFTLLGTTGKDVSTYANLNLSAGTTYYYKVRAFKQLGSGNEYSLYSDPPANATTLTAIPASPSSLSATAVSSSQINLAWADNSTNESGFKIERATSSSGPWSLIATLGANVTSYSNTGLAASTTYYYRAYAYNTAGNSGYSNTAYATTQSSATIPNAPGSITASAASSSQINLAWADNSTNESGFNIERATSSSGPWSLLATLGANVTSYSNTGLAASTTYYYRAYAYNTAGNSGYSNTAYATTQSSVTIPNAPGSITASAASSSQINLAWIDNSTNESGFKIERATSSSGPWSLIANTNVTSYSDTGLAASTTYYYRAYAYNTAGNSGYSNTAYAITQSSATIPNTPGSITASAVSVSQINLAWADNSTNESGFNIERATSSSGPWSQIATLGANVTSYSNTGLSASTAYYYRAYAYNIAGNSGYSNTAYATTISGFNFSLSNSGNKSVSPGSSITNGITATLLSGTSQAVSFSVSGLPTGATGSFSSTSCGVTCTTTLAINTLTTTPAGSSTVTVTATGGGVIKTASFTLTVNSISSGGQTGWAERFGGAQNDAGYSVTVDGSGDIIVVGTFQGTADLGGGPVTSVGAADMYVAKYSPSGLYQWSKHFGGSGTITPRAVALDASGNVVVTGSFTGTVNFGGGSVTGTSYTNDIFVAKYSSSGAYLWSKTFGSTGDDSGYGIAIDSGGNVVVAGTFSAYVDFGGGYLIGYGTRNLFLAKYSPSGAYIWSKTIGNGSNNMPYGMAVDNNDNILVTGSFNNSLDFGGGTLTSNGQSDIFLAKYSSSGAHVWSRGFGSSGSDVGYGIAVDGSGNVVVTGSFMGTVDFGGGTLTSNGQQDVFLAKYSSSGTYLWARSQGGIYSDQGNSVAIDGSGNVIVTGQFYSPVDFGGGLITGGESIDIFAAKYSASGTHLWSEGFGGPYTDVGMGIAVDNAGEIIVTGYFYGTADFGGPILTSAWNDIFMFKLTL